MLYYDSFVPGAVTKVVADVLLFQDDLVIGQHEHLR